MKKVNTDRHTGPLWLVGIAILFIVFLLWYNLFAFLLIVVIPLSVVAFTVGVPYAGTYLWNKFIATEEDYYE